MVVVLAVVAALSITGPCAYGKYYGAAYNDQYADEYDYGAYNFHCAVVYCFENCL